MIDATNLIEPEPVAFDDLDLRCVWAACGHLLGFDSGAGVNALQRSGGPDSRPEYVISGAGLMSLSALDALSAEAWEDLAIIPLLEEVVDLVGAGKRGSARSVVTQAVAERSLRFRRVVDAGFAGPVAFDATVPASEMLAALVTSPRSCARRQS